MPNPWELRAATELVENMGTAFAKSEAGARLVQQSLGLLELSARRLHVQSPSGLIERLTPQQFGEKFGVAYSPRLIFEADHPRPDLSLAREQARWPRPSDDQRSKLELSFGAKLEQSPSEFNRDVGLKEWLYGDKIREGYTANTYISRVSDDVGHGLFAAVDMAPGKMIGEYTGIARGYREGDLKNPYVFSYGADGGIDSSTVGNYTRFINHSSQNPNTNFARVLVDDKEHIILVTTRDIRRGDQLLFNYGEGYWDKRVSPKLI